MEDEPDIAGISLTLSGAQEGVDRGEAGLACDGHARNKDCLPEGFVEEGCGDMGVGAEDCEKRKPVAVGSLALTSYCSKERPSRAENGLCGVQPPLKRAGMRILST